MKITIDTDNIKKKWEDMTPFDEMAGVGKSVGNKLKEKAKRGLKVAATGALLGGVAKIAAEKKARKDAISKMRAKLRGSGSTMTKTEIELKKQYLPK